jgi:MoaA/NifB/PqqE/SkfB family radical SAM enzyme
MLDRSKVNMIEFDLTGTCNLNCPLCARNYKTLNEAGKIFYNERSVEDIIEQIKLFPNLNKINLVGATSEPTLYKEIFHLIKELHNLNLDIEICTNGDTHNPEWWYKLGKLLKEGDSVYFSVCGSTQELHETYRVNCSLDNLLANAAAFKNINKNDYIQHILFAYNKEDLNSTKMREMIETFNNVNYTKTYFTRDHSTYVDDYNLEKLPIHNEDLKFYQTAINYTNQLINKTKLERKSKTMHCTSFEDGSIHIDQSGNIYPCYIWLEESGINIWDQDYGKILDFEYDCCKFCEKNIRNILRSKGCELL